MAVIEEALVAKLKGDGTVAGLVGTRVYPLVAPAAAARPLVTYQVISDVSEHSHDANADLERTRVQFGCVASTYAGAKGLARAVRSALRHYQGTVSGVKIDAILAENEVDSFSMSVDQSQSSYVTAVDVLVWHH